MLQMPVREAPEVIPEFEPQHKLFKVMRETGKWGEELGVATVGELNELITGKTNKKSSCRDITDLILVQEALMEKRMAHIADAIAKDPKKKIILIAGPSSSGKTTFSYRLSVQLKAAGLRPHPIGVDNYFVDREKSPKDADGNYISATNAVEDTFGHSQLSGTGKCLEYIIKENIQVKVRSVEINILQRSAAHMSSITDIGEAFRLGRHAVKCAIEGKTGIMVTSIRKNNEPYSIDMGETPVENVAGLVKHVPREWINERGNNVTQEFIDYAYPLILGEPVVKYQRGIPDYLDISHLFPNKFDN